MKNIHDLKILLFLLFISRSLLFCRSLLTAVLLIAFSLTSAAQNGAWVKKAQLPSPRAGASASVFDNRIYVIGYYHSVTDLGINDMYDPLTNTWATKKAMPTPRGMLATAVVNDTIYAIAGGNPYSPLNKVEAYDPLTDTWTNKADMLMPNAEMQADTVNGIIYVVGGAFEKRNCFAYDPAANKWTEKKPRPDKSGVMAVTSYNGLIYTFGGGQGPLGPAFSLVYAYDPKTDTWIKKKNMPTARFSFRAFLINNKIYAVGGSRVSGNALPSVEVYDPQTDTWEIKADMPVPLCYFAGAVVNNKIYVIGGTSDWATGKSDVWEYDPAFHTDIDSGSVSGRWRLKESPYNINGEITVPKDSTLTIEPGVEVIFTGHYKFNVKGRLLAVGTKTDSIRFTAEDKKSGWHGIRFLYTPASNDTSKFIYCSFKYGKANTGEFSGSERSGGAIFMRGFGKVIISDCLFESNMNNGEISATGGAAVYVNNASPVITKSTFRNNSGTTDCSVLCTYTNAIMSNNKFLNNSGAHAPVTCLNGSPKLSGNLIMNNTTTRAGGGIFVVTTTAKITNNIVIHNSCFGVEGEGGGIKSWLDDKSAIINNTIAFNSAAHGGGLCFNQNAEAVLINNIIWGNTSSDGSQVNIVDYQSDPQFLYCDIEGGKKDFRGTGAGDYSGIYENNIDKDPVFSDTSKADYQLSANSPCIGAGIDSVIVSGTWYYAPPFCMMGNPRPSPPGTRPDIGACESLLGTPLASLEDETIKPEEFSLEQNYPNPFNPSTIIKFSLPYPAHVTLKIFDILGREIITLLNEEKPAGIHKATWKADNIKSGVYIYEIRTENYLERKKMILLR